MTATAIRHARPETASLAAPASPCDRLLQLLCCPHCHAQMSVSRAAESWECAACDAQATRQGEQIRCGGFTTSEVEADWLNRVKESAKRTLGARYQWAIDQISPVYTGYLGRRIKRFLQSYDLARQHVADLGSGPLRHDPQVICCDGMNYDNVNLVTDLEHLPIRKESLDGVISVAVLEHVTNPPAHVAEMLRVLKPGGRVLCFIPFLQGYHASPYDYQRFTISGMRHLFRDFELVSLEPAAGPTSSLVWIFQEWLAMVLSCGIRPLYRAIMPMTYVLSPLKYLDVLLRHHPAAANIDCGFIIEARKPGMERLEHLLAGSPGPHFRPCTSSDPRT